MRRGTTPRLLFALKDKSIDLTLFSNIIVTIKSGDYMQNWDMSEIAIDNDEKVISVRLTQEDTLSFPTGKVEVQLRFLAVNGKAYATKIIKTSMNAILYEGVIE